MTDDYNNNSNSVIHVIELFISLKNIHHLSKFFTSGLKEI